jgi:hypothetical protein
LIDCAQTCASFAPRNTVFIGKAFPDDHANIVCGIGFAVQIPGSVPLIDPATAQGLGGIVTLIAVTASVMRRSRASRLGAGERGGQRRRLAVVDAARIDKNRTLVLVSRDNIEHLLMIGGPTDIVIEPNIVRVGAGPARRACTGCD